MSEPTPLHNETRELAAALGLPAFERGWVWLAGAGPGDAGLITVLGAHAIQQADVILYDALINETLLALARPGTQRIYAGKRSGVKSCKQSDISRTLVSLAKKGKRVLRLKGGDPFVFGRGGEEALALTRGGVPFRVVPGVTAGIGGLAHAGIPVTHRDTNHAVTFITGHGADGHLPKLDWDAVAKGSPTLVLYMARRTVGEIAAKLIAAGRAAGEPAAIVSNASTGGQSVVVTTLAAMGEAATGTAPAIIVIGENVRLREGLDWVGAMSGRLLEPYPLGRDPLSDAG
ncbi:MAG: uroporphyrinogen-III C-methyltransferase [Alphaproteobacteria bacterium]|nr:uroporphyrinogen-III C-methyltransferase [Alphaproteobacteria bacterium]MBL7096222.1 uroporphyrinogen-III C-methyltransferase [Alphaproteobacteria bacterium]